MHCWHLVAARASEFHLTCQIHELMFPVCAHVRHVKCTSQTSNDNLEVIHEYDCFTDPAPLFSATPASVICQLLKHQVW